LYFLPFPLTKCQPFTLKAAFIFLSVGAVMVFYFQYEKARLERKRVVEMSKGVGKPKVGGPFTLTDLDGKTFSDADLVGKYSLVRTCSREVQTSHEGSILVTLC